MKPILVATLICLCLAGVPGAAAEQAEKAAAAENPKVTLETSKGKIVVELFPDKAPKTVGNFLGYVDSGHYNGTIFHRVINGFMIQGGAFTSEMEKRKSGTPIENEANNGLVNERGTLAMARTNDPHSASDQFFINLVNNSSLNHTGKNARGWGYAVFARVVEGMDVVDAIAKVRTTRSSAMRDVPAEPVVITKAARQ